MKEYLEYLDKWIGQSDELDESVCKLLLYELHCINKILVDESSSYDDEYNIHSDIDISEEKMESTYKYEIQYRDEVLRLLAKIDNSIPLK